MPALDELEAAWLAARDDASFNAELDALLERLRRPPDAALPRPAAVRGRPATRSTSSARTSTTPARTRSTTRSASACSPSAWASGASSPRPAPASTASRPRPRARCSGSSASSTWAPRTCAASRRTCCRMELLGATDGARRRRHARRSRTRSTRRSATGCTNVDTTYYLLGSVRRPAPVPDDRARPAARDRRRGARADARAGQAGCPTRVVACVGGGSNAIGTLHRVRAATQPSRSSASRRRRGHRDRAPRRAAHARRPRRRAARRVSAILQDEDGQILEAHSISRRPRLPRRRPRARLAARQRPRALRGGHRRRRARRVPPPRRARGDHPGARVLARDRVAAGVTRRARTRSTSCACRAAATRTSRRRSTSSAWHERPHRRGVHRRRRPRRADAVPDGRLPGRRELGAIGAAYADAGADLVELGVPFSDPLADGPVIHAAAHDGAGERRDRARCLEAGARIAEHVPVVLMCYANPIYARGPERFAAELAAPGISGLIVPDLPLEESAAMLAACDAPRRRARPARGADDAGRAARRDRHAVRVDLSTRSR